MNIEKLEGKIQSLITNLVEETFIYDLLLAYEQPKAAITRLKNGDYNLSKVQGEILWKKKLFFKKESERDLHSLIDSLKDDPAIIKHHPRFIVITDFKTLLSIDTKTADTLDIPFLDLVKYFDFFLPWAGMEKSQLQSENPADIKAAERMGRLYDIILEDNPVDNENDRHALNIFLSRLLFCFFAEDTEIFADGQFTNGLASHTSTDGSDLQIFLQKLFKVLNLSKRSGYPQFLQDFPYVNGGLFADEYPVPMFSAKSRKIIIECGALNWKAINPDIFGSMIQAVVHTDQRGNLGMHYTSVINIMKVIEPLFLSDLYDDLKKAGNNEKKLIILLERLYHLRIFDPACGSGNFLIVAFKELCSLETAIFKQLYGRLYGNDQLTIKFFSNIKLTQFYGIELDDFAHETAKLALWLVEHQMNLAFMEEFGETRPTLPLQDGGNIVCGNATRLNWEKVCPKDKGYKICVLGNPPYLGSSMQSENQKADMSHVFNGLENYKKQDYISCWFFKASKYIQEQHRFAFVTTNSICQGTQVEMTWPYIFKMGLEIFFTHKSFAWSNNAKGNAGVICSIIGIRPIANEPKYIFKNSLKTKVQNINAYLVVASSTIVNNRSKPLSTLPKMTSGNKPLDGGNLVLSTHEKELLQKEFPESINLIKRFIGSSEFIRGTERWCLWIPDSAVDFAKNFHPIADRIERVKIFRLAGGNNARNKAHLPHKFEFANEPKKIQIILPRVSSIRRKYIPMGFFDKNTVVADSAQVIFDPETYVLSIISSRMHMTWVKVTSGRLKSDYRYIVVPRNQTIS